MVAIIALAALAAVFLTVAVFALNRVGEVKADLIVMQRDRDGLRVMVERQRAILLSDQDELARLRNAISSDASGRVGRGKGGRFQSVKG